MIICYLTLLFFLPLGNSSFDISYLQNYHVTSVNSEFFKRNIKTFKKYHVQSIINQEEFFQNLHHPEQIVFEFKAFNKLFHAAISKNYDFIPKKYTEHHQIYRAGVLVDSVINRRKKNDECFYRGDLLSKNGGTIGPFVAINTCDGGLSGLLITAEGQSYGIEPAWLYLKRKVLDRYMDHGNDMMTLHIVYRVPEDMSYNHMNTSFCASDINHRNNINVFQSMVHQIIPDNKRDSSRKLKSTRVTQWVELMVVNDVARFNLLGQKTEQDAKKIVNLIDEYYDTAQFKPPVRIALVAQITWQNEDPYISEKGICSECASDEVGVSTLLSNFHKWRQHPDSKLPSHDNAQLFSGFDFEGGVLGYGGVGTMCTYGRSGAVCEAVKESTAFSAAVVSHEMGHNFGMRHDGKDNVCPSKGYIMNSFINNPAPKTFSECSYKSYENFIAKIKCLDNHPTELWGKPVCGNGFIEAGEQCDCNNNVDCADTSDPCCNAKTCQLLDGMKCSRSQLCCSNICMFKAKGEICRDAASFCDVSEVCDGKSPVCPEDLFKGAGTKCIDEYGSGMCYHSVCSSHERQCRFTGELFHGGSFHACSSSAQKTFNGGEFCGILYCSADKIGQCTLFRLDNQQEIMNDGVPCGDNKQCSSGKCIRSSELLSSFRWSSSLWTPCKTCSTPQTRKVNCIRHTKNHGFIVDDIYCPPNSKPIIRRDCINATLRCISSNNRFSQIGRGLAKKFRAYDIAQTLRDIAPRIYGPEIFSPGEPKYWIGITLVGFPGIIFSILGFLTCCCHSFGVFTKKEINRQVGYKVSEIWVPFGILVFCVLLILIFSIIGLFFTTEIHNGMSNAQSGAGSILINAIDDGINYANRLKNPLFRINESLITTSNQIEGVINEVNDPLMAGATPLLKKLRNLGIMLTDHQGDYGFNCIPCDGYRDTLADIRRNIEDNTTAIFNSMKYNMNSIQTSLIKNLSDVYSAIETFNEQVEQTSMFIMPFKETISRFSSQIDSIDTARMVSVVPIFLLPFVTLLFVLGTIFRDKIKGAKYMTRISDVGYVLLIIMGFMFALHLSSAMVIDDSCKYLSNHVEKNLSSLVGFYNAYVLNACLRNTSLVLALNNTNIRGNSNIGVMQVLFNNIIPPDFPNIEETFSLDSLEVFQASVSNLTLQTTFGYSDMLVNIELANLNQLTYPTVFTLDDIKDINPEDFPDNEDSVKAQKHAVLILLKVKAMLVYRLLLIQGNVSKLSTPANHYKKQGRYLVKRFNEIKTKIKPVADPAHTLKSLMHCGFFGVAYQNFQMAWCNTVVTSFSLMSFSSFIIMILSIPIIILGLVVSERLNSPIRMTNPHPMDHPSYQKLRDNHFKVEESDQNSGNLNTDVHLSRLKSYRH